MLGGDPESELSRAHARELLDSAGAPGEDAATASTATRGTKRGGRRA